MCIITHENTRFKPFAEAGVVASDELDAALPFDRPHRPFRQIRVGMRHCYDAFPSGMPKLVVAALHADFTPAGGSNFLDYFSALHAHQIHTPITRSDYKARIKYSPANTPVMSLLGRSQTSAELIDSADFSIIWGGSERGHAQFNAFNDLAQLTFPPRPVSAPSSPKDLTNLFATGA